MKPKLIILEVYQPNEDAIKITALTREQAKEYFDRMTPETKFQFFEMQHDGSRKEINFNS